MNHAYAVVDLRSRPRIVGRFHTLSEACERLQQMPDGASHDVFRLVEGGICQLDRRQADTVRRARRFWHSPGLGAPAGRDDPL